MTLMDMASIMGKYHARVLKDQAIEVSEETTPALLRDRQ